jgi:hypothetical protein
MSREKWQENVRWANNSTTPSNFVEGILWADSRIRELEDAIYATMRKCSVGTLDHSEAPNVCSSIAKICGDLITSRKAEMEDGRAMRDG